MSKAYSALCLLLILVLLTGCGTRIVPAVPTVTPSAPPAEEDVPPPPTPTPLLSPPPEAVHPSPRVSPSPRISATVPPAQQHYPPRLPENWSEELPAAETVSRAETYTVDPGDCLWTIAEKVYGSGNAWRSLWAANRETVADPGLVWVGQVLRLPEEAG